MGKPMPRVKQVVVNAAADKKAVAGDEVGELRKDIQLALLTELKARIDKKDFAGAAVIANVYHAFKSAGATAAK